MTPENDLQIRRIRANAIPAALDKARVYRFLNEPEQAESICLDILAIEPGHSDAVKTLILALTDQFHSRTGTVKRARARVAELPPGYDQAYYAGLICEREARAHLGRHVGAAFAHELFMQAIRSYARAEALAPTDNDDAILRRNSCLRTLQTEGLEPMTPTSELPLE